MCLAKIRAFLLSPKKAFEKERKTGLAEAFKYNAIILIPIAILGSIVSAYFMPAPLGLSNPVFVITLIVVSYVIGIVFSLIWPLWLHTWAYIFGAKEGLDQTFKAGFYGNTPYYLLGWIPFVSIIFLIWAAVLQGIGLMALHKMPKQKAALAVIIAIAIPVALILALIGIFFLAFLGFPVTGPL